MTDTAFPLDSFKDAAPHTRRPFTPEAVKFKVQSDLGGKGALIVAYIDARLVVERLNLLVPHLWWDEYTALDGNTLRCDLTVDGLTRRDVGQGPGKTGYSDALKRAAVKFGVGVSLYSIPQSMLWLEQHGKFIAQRKQGQKQVTTITDEGDRALRKKYEAWLHAHGRQAFGDELDHGDVGVSVGDPDAGEDAPEREDEPIRELVEGPEADVLRAQARDLYARIVNNEGKGSYPPGQFNAALEAHGDSLDRLRDFVAGLAERVKVPA